MVFSQEQGEGTAFVACNENLTCRFIPELILEALLSYGASGNVSEYHARHALISVPIGTLHASHQEHHPSGHWYSTYL